MARRTPVITGIVVLLLACAAVPAALPRCASAAATPASAVAAADIAITFDVSPTRVRYGQVAMVAGRLTQGGKPVPGTAVTLYETRDGVSRDRGTATTDDQGFYRTIVRPGINASWHASAAGALSPYVAVRVAPRVSLELSHPKPRGTRLTEVFSGSVRPAHTGSRVRIQKSVRSGWRTVASGLLDDRSRYRIVWAVPYRTATYKLRAVLPAGTDYAQGTSQQATLRVVVRRR